jgi:formyltetrahydrofolate-dependent phosphoribosylglycinamide formyltransferase
MLLSIAGLTHCLPNIPKPSRMAILASGTGSNAEAIIKAVHTGTIQAPVSLVLSDKADAGVLQKAKGAGIPTHVMNKQDYAHRLAFDEDMHRVLVKHQIDFIILAGFMRLLSPWFCETWVNRCVNIHPSLLPSFKGANAIEDALKAQVSITGCTVHLVTPEVDSGQILGQAAVMVEANDTKETLAVRIHAAEHQLYPRILAELTLPR